MKKETFYFDTNFYRKYKNDIQFYNRINAFNDRFLAGLKTGHIIFTWLQFIENVDLGQIIATIVDSQEWENRRPLFKDNNDNVIIKSLESFFNIFYEIAVTHPQLQREYLLNKIKINIQFAHAEASYLLDCTLPKKQNIIQNSDYYREEIAIHLAWACVTSEDFIQSINQWEKRSFLYDSLIAFWHKSWVEGRKLDPYRLFEKRYFSYTHYSQKEPFDSITLKKIKSRADLCDGELIYYIALGHEGNPVTGVTLDSDKILEKRVAIMKQSLLDMCDLENWAIHLIEGQIFKIDNNNSDLHIIRFDTPFGNNESMNINI